MPRKKRSSIYREIMRSRRTPRKGLKDLTKLPHGRKGRRRHASY